MAEQKTELHRLFEKLDEAFRSPENNEWSLQRVEVVTRHAAQPGDLEERVTRAMKWAVRVPYLDRLRQFTDTPEEAVRAILRAQLDTARLRGKSNEESAQSQRDEIARLQRIVESP